MKFEFEYNSLFLVTGHILKKNQNFCRHMEMLMVNEPFFFNVSILTKFAIYKMSINPFNKLFFLFNDRVVS